MIIEKNIFEFLIKTYVVGAHSNHLNEWILMSTHSIGFCDEISKVIPLLPSNTHFSFRVPSQSGHLAQVKLYMYFLYAL